MGAQTLKVYKAISHSLENRKNNEFYLFKYHTKLPNLHNKFVLMCSMYAHIHKTHKTCAEEHLQIKHYIPVCPDNVQQLNTKVLK